MKFYKVNIESKINFENKKKKMKNGPHIVGYNETREFAEKCSPLFFEHYMNTDGDSLFFIYELNKDTIMCNYAVKDEIDKKFISSFPWNEVGVKIKKISYEEITSKMFAKNLERARRNNFMRDDFSYLKKFNMPKLFDNYDGFFGCDDFYKEDVLHNEDITFDRLSLKAEKIFWSTDLNEELKRIYKNANKHSLLCHPVHYTLSSDNFVDREKACNILINALYKNNRLKSKRISQISLSNVNFRDMDNIEELYENSYGGTVVIRFKNRYDNYERDEASSITGIIENISQIISKYRNKVLTILCFPKQNENEKEMFYEHLLDMCFVELSEDALNEETVRKFINRKVKEDKVKTDNDLLEIVKPTELKDINDLQTKYESWFSAKIKKNVYTDYSSFEMAKKYVSKKDIKGSAIEELNSMIGLEKAKKTIKESIDFYKMQKIYADKGINKERPSLHMVFTGHPGTAKTSVARLFAKILKDNKVLSCGHLVEVGRSDLVGKYVGWTAKIVKEKFREAKGGVLFIDEAYSLVDDRRGMFGDEAINTIVQEMENNRNDLVVIFAGYPDEMKEFLATNPGLRSRIAFHINFDDYNTDDLINITKLMIENQKMKIDDNVIDKLKYIFDNVRSEHDFGNGRFVRNLIEHARMRQATRLMNKDNYEKLSNDELTTLTADDFEKEFEAKEERTIGFSV